MDDKLIQEITNFCKLNDIEDVEKQINACLRKGFNILKYGTSPIDNYKIEKNIYGTEDGKRDSPKEEEILTDLYNLILDKEVGIKERELYKKAILLIEKENEYYEAVLFQLVPALSYLARQESISSNGCIFMTKISRFTSNSIGFYLFDSILKK